MFLAVHVWRRRNDAGADSEVTVPKVYLTTLLNPKALIVGLVLLPPLDDPRFSAKLGLFCVAVVGVALLWGMAGAWIRSSGRDGRPLDMLQRIASVWLAVVSLTLITSAIRA
jgi:threonine/homoserine/homoserine lactone efflux protein